MATGNEYYIKPLSSETTDDWNKVIANSDEAWLFHDIELSDALAKNKNAERKSILVYNSNNEPIAICPLYFYNNNLKHYFFRNQRVLESFYSSGPALINKFSDKIRRKVLYFISNEIIKLTNSLKADHSKVGSSFTCKRHMETHYAKVNPLHEMRGRWINTPSVTLYLNLSQSEDELTQRMKYEEQPASARIDDKLDMHIRKMAQSDLVRVYDIHKNKEKPTKPPLYSKEELQYFLECKHSNFNVAEINGKVVSALNIMTYGNGGTLMVCCTATEYKNTAVATNLMQHTILELKKRGILHLDLGSQLYNGIENSADSIAFYKRAYGCELRYEFNMEYRRVTSADKLKFAWNRKFVQPIAHIRVRITNKLKKNRSRVNTPAYPVTNSLA